MQKCDSFRDRVIPVMKSKVKGQFVLGSPVKQVE